MYHVHKSPPAPFSPVGNPRTLNREGERAEIQTRQQLIATYLFKPGGKSPPTPQTHFFKMKSFRGMSNIL